MKCKLSLLLTSFALVCVLLISAPLTANAAVGVGSMWDGSYSISFPSPMIYLSLSRTYRYITNSGGTVTTPEYTGCIYKGDNNLIIDIESKTTDVYLNGSFNLRLNFAPGRVLKSGSQLTVSASPVIMDSVFVSVLPYSCDNVGNAVVDVIVEFKNYYVDQSTISLPLMINMALDTYYDSGIDYNSVSEAFTYLVADAGDYHGDVMQYDNLEDVPSLDGYFAEQNQTIIDQSQTQNNLTNQQNTLIQNQTNQQHQDSQAQINQSIQNSQAEINQGIANTDKVVNGYDDSEMNATSGILGDSVGDLEDAEDVVINFGKENLDAYTITTGGILAVSDKLNSAMSLVSSMLQSVFTSAESWNYVVALGFTLTISSMVTGLVRYFKE